MTKDQVQSGMFLHGDCYPLVAVRKLAEDEFDACLKRADKILDDIGALKAKQRVDKEWRDLTFQIYGR